MTFQRKIIVFFLVFVLVPITILGYISYRISAVTLQETISNQTVQTLHVLDRNLMEAVEEVNHFSDYLISSGDLHSFLLSQNEESLIDLYHQRQAIVGVMHANAQIQQMNLYNKEGKLLYQSSDEFHWNIPEVVLNEMKEKKGGTTWGNPANIQKSLFEKQEDDFLAQGRYIHDIDTLEPLGYMMVYMRLNLFDEVFTSESKIASAELLINKKGTILYAPDHELIGRRLDIDSLHQLHSGETGYLLDQWNKEKQLITYKPSSMTFAGEEDIWMVSLKPWNEISKGIVYIRVITFLLSGLALLMAFCFNWFYLRRIAGFIGSLQWSMKSVEKGVLETKMKDYPLRELNDLSTRFNSMVQRIKDLIYQIREEEEKNRQAEFKVLQQQINPHFLYNTLESINALAASSGQKKISKMTLNLGRLLRISINGSYEVTVQQEISHVVSYLEIQKIRFEHLFHYKVEIDPALQVEPVLKLILQPLVENILAHAFAQEENGLIAIRGTKTEKDGCFWIEDNGRGIPPRILEELHQKRAGQAKNGHGIRNVHERLKLYYGEKYGLMVCSSEQGTIIRISFPIKEGGSGV
ncbi:MAG: sensor histidine kinase [Cytobacillus gottheilii]|uniref:sensor histidine kinase n=1 Tax=Cytobacillus gottheilii TaxID=859144 RepID=UPI00082EF87C|nr:sensor histidine kinase [Cytobacillus gottheilii]